MFYIEPRELTPDARCALINSGEGKADSPVPQALANGVMTELWNHGLIWRHPRRGWVLTHRGAAVRYRVFLEALDEIGAEL